MSHASGEGFSFAIRPVALKPGEYKIVAQRVREVLESGKGPYRKPELKPPVTNLAGRTSLRDVIGVLSRATVAVGPDSGPMHIAAAVGTPVVSLWGATSPARSVPVGGEDFVIQGVAPCVPCYRKECPIGRLCMQSITAAAVLERVTRAWCVFFVLNGGIALWTAVAASDAAWALYNGGIAYLLMGAMFLGERCLRPRHAG